MEQLETEKAQQTVTGVAYSCPGCQTTLKTFQFHAVTPDICPKGCGLWLDQGELKQIGESDSANNIDQAFEGRFERSDVKSPLKSIPLRTCPAGHQSMDRFEWNVGTGIVIDQCTTCQGVWLDAGELEGYSQYVQTFQANPPQATPEIRAKMEQIKREVEAEWDADLNAAAKIVVPWDLWYIDDMARHLIKMSASGS